MDEMPVRYHAGQVLARFMIDYAISCGFSRDRVLITHLTDSLAANFKQLSDEMKRKRHHRVSLEKVMIRRVVSWRLLTRRELKENDRFDPRSMIIVLDDRRYGVLKIGTVRHRRADDVRMVTRIVPRFIVLRRVKEGEPLEAKRVPLVSQSTFRRYELPDVEPFDEPLDPEPEFATA